MINRIEIILKLVMVCELRQLHSRHLNINKYQKNVQRKKRIRSAQQNVQEKNN